MAWGEMQCGGENQKGVAGSFKGRGKHGRYNPARGEMPNSARNLGIAEPWHRVKKEFRRDKGPLRVKRRREKKQLNRQREKTTTGGKRDM